LAHQAGIKRIVLPKKSGRLSHEREQHEKHNAGFRRGFRFGAGIEGRRISVLNRAFGLNLCLDHGEEGMGRWVGWGILTHNFLRQISRTQLARQAA
jgi:hypothetical protein